MNLNPWQRDSADIVRHALDKLHENTASGSRIAFLLFDMGIEAIMKTYLSLPGKLTGTKIPYSVRKKAHSGSFHEVIEGVLEASCESIIRDNMYKIIHYHGIRNKIYHEGNGITVSREDVKAYSAIVVESLYRLLKVDFRVYQPNLNDHHLQDVNISLEDIEYLKDQYREQILEFRVLMDNIFQKLDVRVLDPRLWYEANLIQQFLKEEKDIIETERRLYDFASRFFAEDVNKYLSDYVNEDDLRTGRYVSYLGLEEDDDYRLSRIINDIPFSKYVIPKFELRDFLYGKEIVLSSILWQIAPSQNCEGISGSSDPSVLFFSNIATPYRSFFTFLGSDSIPMLEDIVNRLGKSLVDVKRFFITVMNS